MEIYSLKHIETPHLIIRPVQLGDEIEPHQPIFDTFASLDALGQGFITAYANVLTRTHSLDALKASQVVFAMQSNHQKSLAYPDRLHFFR